MKTFFKTKNRGLSVIAGILALLAFSVPSARAVPDCPECAKLAQERGLKPSIPEPGGPAVNGQCQSGFSQDGDGKCVKASAKSAEE